MPNTWIRGAFALLIMLGLSAQAWAEGPASEKLKHYADLYPDLFYASPVQNMTHRPSSNKSEAVVLLINSFNGDTDVDELAAVLRPNDYTASVIKTDSQIKQLLQAKGLQWKDYIEITHTLAIDPHTFNQFVQHLDQARLERSIISRADSDPAFLGQINSRDQQIIVRNLLEHFKR